MYEWSEETRSESVKRGMWIKINGLNFDMGEVEAFFGQDKPSLSSKVISVFFKSGTRIDSDEYSSLESLQKDLSRMQEMIGPDGEAKE